MSDIVERLRPIIGVGKEAADEIESLRAKLEQAEMVNGLQAQSIGSLNEQLRAAEAKVAELEAELKLQDDANEILTRRAAELEAKQESLGEPFSSILATHAWELYEGDTPKHEAVEPVAWMYRERLHDTDPSDWATEHATPLYTQTPQTQAAVAAALIKAAEIAFSELAVVDWGTHVRKAILALPRDDSHLREFGMRVADECLLAVSKGEKEYIVDRVLKGETK